MKTFKFLFCFLAGLVISNALAKTEQVTLKKNIILVVKRSLSQRLKVKLF